MAIKTTTTVTGKVVTYDTDTGRIISEESPTTPSSPTVSSSSSGSSGSSGSSSNSNMDNIANANPSEKANKAFVDALFQEKYNRNATSAEVTKFKKNTVKDASNLVLGQADSPFRDTATTNPVPIEEATGEITQKQIDDLNVAVEREGTEAEEPGDKANIEFAEENLGYVRPETPEPTEILGGSGMTFEDLTSGMDLENTLSTDQIELLKQITKITFIGDDEYKQKMLNSLKEAYEYADPYYKQQMKIAEDSVNTAISGVKKDYTETEADLIKRINEISQDLEYNSGELDLEQQKDIAREKARLENELDGTRNTMAMRGLAFSGLRTEAEKQLNDESQDILGSSAREYDRQVRDLKTTSARQTEEATINRNRLEASYQEGLKSIGRKAELLMGTGNTPTIEGYTNLGGNDNVSNISGTIQDNKLENIQSLADTLQQQKTLNT